MVDIASNRKAVKYTKREMLCRILWGWGRIVFRLSPRPCFAFRRFWLRLFGAKVGRNVHIYPTAHIYFPWLFEIGEDSSVGEWALVYNLGPVRVGRRVTLSQRCHLCAGTHDYRDPAMPLEKPPIDIKDEVWICADAFVGPGVTVNDGAIVGARAVVVKDVGSSSIVAGNPAREVGVRE